MKAYKVRTGWEKDFYGNTTNTEIAKYFFNKEEAETYYRTGEYTTEETVIYTTKENGEVVKAITGAQWFEDRKRNAKENERVAKETVIRNAYTIEEIEIN